MGRRLPLSAICLLVLGACSGAERVVTEPMTSVARKLVAMPQASDATQFALQMPGTSVYVAPENEPDGERLVWHFTQDGKDYCRFYAELRPRGPDKTRVRTWSEKAPDAGDAIVAAGGRRPDHRYLCNMARLAGEESVSATLQGRAFDRQALMSRVRANVAADPLAVGGMAADVMDQTARMMKDDGSAGRNASRSAAMDAANQAREQDLRSRPNMPVGSFNEYDRR